MKKILVGYLTSNAGSGIDKYLSYFHKNLPEDIEVDYLTKSDIDDVSSIFGENANVIKISKNRKILKQFFELRKIMKENKYDVAYFNISETFNFIGVLSAKLYGIKKIAVHSHSSGIDKENRIKRIFLTLLNYLCRPIIHFCSNRNLACSKEAARWMFGNNVVKNGSYELIFNAVDYDRFKPDERIRKKIRKKYNLTDKFVIGHVGRFCYQKNHKFLIDIFEKILKIKKNAVLMCIGDGEDFNEIEQLVKDRKIENNVIFTGNVDNVNEFMQSFDIFLLPSKFEGLPIVGVEAQMAGIPCLFSDKISDEIIISSKAKLLNIDNSDIWVDNILEFEDNKNTLTQAANNFKLENVNNQFKKVYDSDIEENSSYFIFTLLNILLSLHFLLNLTSKFNGLNYLLIPVFFILMFIMILYIKNMKKIVKDRAFILLLMFMLSYVLTFVLSKNYMLVNTLKIAVWMVMQLFFVFFVAYFKDKKKMQKEINVLLAFILIIFSIINIYNIYLLLFNISGVTTSFDGQDLIYGLSSWGRFYGIFYDPNYASVICGCCVLIAVYLYKLNNNKVLRIFLILSIIVQSSYMIFCESRTCKISFFAGLLLYTILSIIKKYKSKSLLPIIINFALVTFAVFCVPRITINLYNNIRQTLDSHKTVEYVENNNYETAVTISENNNYVENNSETGTENIENIVISKDDDNDKLIGREDVTSDISNRRLDIWKSGIEIFKQSPIYGIGFANITSFAFDKIPDTYIVNNDFATFDAFHNVIIDITVSQGIIGIIVFILIFIYFLVYIIKKIPIIINDGENANINILLLSCIALIFASSMFVSEIFYINNACTYMFWLFMGYYYFLNKSKEGECL